MNTGLTSTRYANALYKFAEQKQQEDLMDINNSFITKYEYGKMLYNNPRGIGCNSCHGNDARGRKMVDFKQTHEKKVYNCTLVIPDIKNIDYETFSIKVNSLSVPKPTGSII